MLRRTLLVSGIGVLAVLAQVLLPTVAFAHHPEVTASVDCTRTGAFVIEYTATAWEAETDPLGRAHPNIDILFDEGVVDTGSFSAGNSYTFSGSAPAPAGAGPGDTVTVTALAVGPWGNSGGGGESRSVEVTLPSSCGTGRFTGGGHQIVGGARITRGLTIHCDLLLSNNLEVNWGGNRFHMTEHLTTVECSDDPTITQRPPVAPLDTLIGTGSGRYNGTDGFTIEFTLVDAGEPGTSDKAALKIYETANPGNVVLNVPLQVLTGGNLQAHFDQPHRR